jgi:hypothetical protein
LIVFGITFFLFVILFGIGMLCKHFDILNSFVSLIISLGSIGIVYLLVKSICKLIVIFESKKAIMSQLAYDIKTKEESNQYSWFTERTYEKMKPKSYLSGA